MARSVVGLTRDVLAELSDAARSCAFWELDPVSRGRRPDVEACRQAKEGWVSSTLLEWGCCGQVAYLDDRPAGYLLYAPASFVPSADGFATAPVAADAVLLTTGQVFDEFRGSGVGRVLVQAVVKDLARRRVKAIEAFASRTRHVCRQDPREACLLPVDFLCSVGFRTVRPHWTTPRLRLDVRSAVSWRADVSDAVDRLLGTLRPAGGAAVRGQSARV